MAENTNAKVSVACQRICDVLSSWTNKQSEETQEHIHRLFSYPLTLGMNLLVNSVLNGYSDSDIEKTINAFFKDFLIVGVTGESAIENDKGMKMTRREEVVEDE